MVGTAASAVLEQERKTRDSLDAHGIEFGWIEPKRFDNGGCNLLIQHLRLDVLCRLAWHGDKQRDVQVILVETAVFCDLRSASKDHAGVGFQHDVGSADREG